MVDFHKAVRALYDDVYYVNNDQAYDINDNEINVDMNLINAWQDPEEYKYKRELEYPDFREYLDGIVKGDQAQIDKYIADCQAVKLKYPKGSE